MKPKAKREYHLTEYEKQLTLEALGEHAPTVTAQNPAEIERRVSTNEAKYERAMVEKALGIRDSIKFKRDQPQNHP